MYLLYKANYDVAHGAIKWRNEPSLALFIKLTGFMKSWLFLHFIEHRAARVPTSLNKIILSYCLAVQEL